MSDRIFAALWLAAVAGAALVAWKIEVPFSYEPIGPRAFPWLLCALMAACAVRLLWRPDAEPGWPRGSLAFKSAALVAVLFAYAFLFEILGFVIATAALGALLGRLFDGGWKASVVAGIAMGIGFWLFFDKALDVTLPSGLLGRLLG